LERRETYVLGNHREKFKHFLKLKSLADCAPERDNCFYEIEWIQSAEADTFSAA